MTVQSNSVTVCFDCARKAGFVTKKKVVCAWHDECCICHEYKLCSDLLLDWKQTEERR